jgi:hypothetical protein
MRPCYVQVCLKCLNIFSSVSSRSKTKETKSYRYIPRTVFEVQPNNFLNYSIDIININTGNSVQDNYTRPRLFNQFLMPVRPLVTSPGPLKRGHSPRSDVLMREIIQMSTLGSFVVNFDLLNNKNSTVIELGMYCKCITSVVLKYCIFRYIFVNPMFQ